MASAVVGVLPHDGSAATGVTFNSPAALNVLSHSHGCEQMTGLGGSVYVFVNGIRNKSAGTDLKLACALTSPPDGFDIALDYAGADVNDLSKVASVSVRSCFTARAVPGVGCGTAESTSQAGTGIYGIQVELPEATVDEDAVRYVEVTLPKMDGDAASVLRSFGYYDHSAAIGGGGDTSALEDAVADLSSDVTALTATVDGHTASINSLTSTSNAHTGAIADLEAEVSTLLGGVDLSALEDTVAAHTTSINNLDGAVQGHTTQLGMHTTQLTALENSASGDAVDIAAINSQLGSHSSQLSNLDAEVGTLQGDVAGLLSNMSSAQSEIGTLQSNVSVLQGNVGGLQTDVSTLQSDMFTTAATVLSHENTVNTHTAQLSGASGSGLKTSIDAHTDQLSGSASSGLKTLINANASELSSQSALLSVHESQLQSHDGQLSTINSQLAGSTGSALKTQIDANAGQLSTHAGQLMSLAQQDQKHHQRFTQLESLVLYRAFVTSTTHPGNIGGLPAADAICQMRADAANLGGTWWAWLSNQSWSPSSGFARDEVLLLNVNGEPIAKGWTDYTDGSLIRGIELDENGVSRLGDQVWTGTLPDGTKAGSHCTGWTSSTGSGVVGLAGSPAIYWTNSTTQPCTTQQRLYCFQVYL